MANNRLQAVWIALLLVGAFLAGGWFFSWRANSRAVRQEVESVYAEDGETWGIFEQIPLEEQEEAASIAAGGLNVEDVLPEETTGSQPSENQPRQIVTDLSEVAAIILPGKKEGEESQKEISVPVQLNLTGNEKVAVSDGENMTSEAADDGTQMTMLKAPVRARLVRNMAEYKEFKQIARGTYPTVNFTKDMLIVLESESNLPDNMFDIVSVQAKDGKLEVTYRVNVLGLDKKLNTHAVQVVKKQDLPIELIQVL